MLTSSAYSLTLYLEQSGTLGNCP